ncbi:MAG: N-acetyl sugar amidotransferase [Pseudomonadota bacterium]|nr:N-acetyl sugar amidotransferase [Pseudomonadota bacterium]
MKYRMCTRCFMDINGPDITFDSSGVCNHCREFDEVTSKRWFPNAEDQTKLEALVARIKKEGYGKAYDCILGLSGGLDSSYLALVMKDHGLRPLVVHVDAGWNSEFAVRNIEAVVEHCDFELHTILIDWEEVKDLQLAYLKAGVANQDVVQDHAFFAALYHFAVKNDVRYVIGGGNVPTECIFPASWHHAAMDAINLKAIHRKYGVKPLKNFPLITFFEYYFYYPFIKKMTTVRPLNLMPYSKEIALKRLTGIGFVPYERKHGESRFTKFFQNYYLPKKFNMDKRKPHLSSMIVTGIITREEALEALQAPLYDEAELKEDKEYIAGKLGVTVAELEGYIEAPPRHYSEFANWDGRYRLLKAMQLIANRLTGKSANVYS